jgi:hypothetical protein
MKTNRMALSLLALLLLAAPVMAQHAETHPGSTTDPSEACALVSWSPELFSFYGDKNTVLAKFQSLDRNLLKHRVWAFVVESNNGAKLTFFELNGDLKSMDVASATGASFQELSDKITTGLLSNTGSKCAGRFTKGVIQDYTKGQLAHTSIPRPSSAGQAFEYAVSQSEGNYIRATFILLC